VSADWAAAGGGGLPVTTSVRLGGDGRAAVFAVSFPQGAGGTAAQGYQNCALLGALGVRLAADGEVSFMPGLKSTTRLCFCLDKH
jgi:hypothetical protein